MDKIKVVHSSPIWLTQTETWLYHQIKHLDSTIDPYILCKQVKNLDQFYVENIKQLPNSSFIERCLEKLLNALTNKKHSIPLIRELRKIKPAVLHSHLGNCGWLDMPAAKLMRIPHVVTFYGFDVNRLPRTEPIWKKRYRTLFNHVDLVLCEGSFMAKSILKLGSPEHKVKVHHLGVPLNNIPFKPRIWQKGQPLRVLIAASFREKKGIPYALEALGQIQSIVPIMVTIIGDADHESRSQVQKKKIFDTIEHYKFTSKVKFLGYQPHSVLLKEAYDHHVFMSPSVTALDGDTEGGAPVTLIEMAATGIPLVSTRHCDIPEVILDGETGFLAEERDVKGLITILEKLIANRDNWSPFLTKSRKHIESEYNAEIQGVKLSKIYKEVSAI